MRRSVVICIFLSLALCAASSECEAPHIEPLCEICKLGVTVVRGLLKSNSSLEKIESELAKLCGHAKSGYPEYVCTGAISEYGPEVVQLLLERRIIPGDELCVQTGFCSIVKSSCTPASPPSGGRVLQRLRAASSAPPVQSNDVGKFWHLSDLHVDPLYQVGAVPDCGNPCCCRAEDGMAPQGHGAGVMGQYGCDAPYILINSTLQFVATQEVDFIIITGDLPPHDVWEQSRAENLNATKMVMASLHDTFNGTLILPTMGNHEAFPCDQFGPNGATEWLYDEIATLWSEWLPSECIETIRYGGYYSMLVRPKLRFISINTQFGDIINFYVTVGNYTDIAEQFEWLDNVLADAERNGEGVIIAGHIQPGLKTSKPSVDMTLGFQRRYTAIVTKYAHIIKAQLFGHTHKDEVRVFNDKDGNPISAALVTAAVTPHSGGEPSVRLFTYDRDTNDMLEYTVFSSNLDDANEHLHMKFDVLYNTRIDYNMTSLSASEVVRLLERMDGDEDLFRKYIAHYYVRDHRECVGQCKTFMLCALRYTDIAMYADCIRAGGIEPDAVALSQMV